MSLDGKAVEQVWGEHSGAGRRQAFDKLNNQGDKWTDRKKEVREAF